MKKVGGVFPEGVPDLLFLRDRLQQLEQLLAGF